MKGKLLSVEEVRALKDGAKVYIIPNLTKHGNEGLANIKIKEDMIELHPTNGDKRPWRTTPNAYEEDSIRSWLAVYEWIEYKVGDKVVPHAKTVEGYESDIEDDKHWKKAREIKQPYLYVIRINITSDGEEYLTLAYDPERRSGNYYAMSDVTPYVEPDRAALEKEVKHMRHKAAAKRSQLEHYEKCLATKEAELKKLTPSVEEELKELEKPHYVTYAVQEYKNIVIAAVNQGLFEDVKIGIAICDPDDKFDLATGKLIALKRALGIKFNASQYGEAKNMAKLCSTCKYEKKAIESYPCRQCQRFDLWEKKVS